MSSKYEKLYASMPIFLQTLMLNMYSVKLDRERYSKEFKSFREELLANEFFGENILLDQQEKMLSRIIKHAYQTVPYYNKLFKDNKLQPDDIKSLEDLPKIPVLTKDIIKKNFNELWSRDFHRKSLVDGHTSGTTGTPLEVLYDKRMMGMTYAAMDRQYRWAGVNFNRFGDRIATLRGNIIVPLSQKKPPYWRLNAVHNQLYLSNFHLSPETLPHYLKKLNRFKPKVIDGYPSSLYVLAKYMLNQNETLPIDAILTSSETLYDFQRCAIEKAFSCKVFDYYGHAERVIFAGECEYHSGHHIFPEYGIAEIVDRDNFPVGPGEEGMMIGTTLQNFGMPLIRYVTNDRTGIKVEDCACGRSFPLMNEVATKAEDLLKLKDGRFISPSVLTHPFKPLNSISGSQIIQTDLDRICVKLIPGENFENSHRSQLVHDLKERLGESINIEIELVDALPRTKSGKFKWVVSNVDLGL
ncbi:phenylacetate--CoA ligase family protein [Porticoccus sp. GXU_MW_L64]